jgi:Skp family chaperone for outer membrane proteins
MMKKFLLLAAIGGLIFATSAVPADAAPRRAADGTETTTSTTQRSQSTRNRSASQGQKANRQNRSSNKANRNRAPRTPPAEG